RRELAGMAAEVDGGREAPANIVQPVAEPLRDLPNQEIIFAETGGGTVAAASYRRAVEDAHRVAGTLLVHAGDMGGSGRATKAAIIDRTAPLAPTAQSTASLPPCPGGRPIACQREDGADQIGRAHV